MALGFTLLKLISVLKDVNLTRLHCFGNASLINQEKVDHAQVAKMFLVTLKLYFMFYIKRYQKIK